MTEATPTVVPAKKQGHRKTARRELLARRHNALAQLAKGASFRSVVVLKRRSTRPPDVPEDLVWCRDRLLHELERVDAAQLLAWWENRVQQLSHKAAQAGNYNAAIAEMKLIFEGFLRREIDKKFHMSIKQGQSWLGAYAHDLAHEDQQKNNET